MSSAATVLDRQTNHRRISWLVGLTWLVILALPAAMVLIINRYAVNVPWMAEWDMLPLVTRAYDHTLVWADIWE